jgi:hypothetical protein
MDTLRYLPVATLVLVILVLLWRLVARGRERTKLPYQKRPALLSAAELRFYHVLREAVPRGMTVFTKVRLMDLVAVTDKAWPEFGAPGSGMHVDFVLADANTTAACLVIELDDKSHLQADAKKRDAFKNAALEAAGLPLLRVKAASRYDVGALRSSIASAGR